MIRSRWAIVARRKLRIAIAVFALALALPLIILAWRVYNQLETENFYRYQSGAESLAKQINQRLKEIIANEESRSFDEYSYYSVSSNALSPEWRVAVSPLSQFPIQSSVPGIIGYFQLDSEKRLTTPLLPYDQEQLQVQNLNELAKRRAIFESMQKILFMAETPKEGSPRGQSIKDLSFDDRLSKSESKSKFSLGAAAPLLENSVRKEKLRVITQNQARNALGDEAGLSAGAAYDNLSPQEEQGVSRVQPETSNSFELSVVEGEIDPLKFSLMFGDRAVFSRRVWRADKRYTQGFIADGQKLFDDVISQATNQSVFRSEITVLIGYKGELLKWFGDSQGIAAGDKKDILLYRTPLIAPLNEVELLITTKALREGPGKALIDMLIVAISTILAFGAIGLYRLGISHIALAEQQNDFVSAVSHELKTPVTSIRMYGEMLRDGMVTDDSKRLSYYNFIFQESERLSRLISNVLQVAKLSRDASPLEITPLKVSELLMLAREKAASIIQSAKFNLNTEIDEKIASQEVGVDQDAMARIFINLVENAIKFSRTCEKKEIIIGARLSEKSDGEIEIYIRDFGPGIDPKIQHKLFKLFQRGESELTRSTAGTGLGLALVRELCNRMGAKVSLKNNEPGLEVVIQLKKIRS